MYGLNLFGKDEIFNKNAKIILGSLIAFLAVLFSSLNYSGYFEKNKRKKVMEENFNGKVIEKKIDYENHGDVSLKLSDSKIIGWYYPKQKIEILVGDSLAKIKGTIYMQLYRKKSEVINVNMLEK